ncbi:MULTISPECIES: DUF2225 domain-containing protein [unclassified Oceanispirochaeta]|uniref:DUF2225 domain-containing protein n=1 Tax=unclassified Oceanispirochaeta TaxID=2635722 RepID=UPI001E457AD4|nr:MULTISPECIES: DUF2225 domain-containing protein [unclassified Oceanispirochaeta]
MAEDKKMKLTFLSKQELECPVCDNTFRKEELLSGGGRMNAGDLTKELHRTYLPTNKFGTVYPLLYPVIICPSCYYASYPSDFKNMKGDRLSALKKSIGNRKTAMNSLFPNLDFNSPRRLQEGIASYSFASMCYESGTNDMAPTFKQAMSCLRAAWLCMDLHKEDKTQNFDYLAQVFYRKAAFFYGRVVEMEQIGEESVEGLSHLGPDLDNNYGFDGVLYLSGYLEYKYGQRSNPERRGKQLAKARSTVSRIVGMGKSSKSKPTAILELSRDLHKLIKDELDELGIET